MECFLVILLRCCRLSLAYALLFRKPFLGAGEGNRTPDPLITNQMLYQLSYASELRLFRLFRREDPSDPSWMSGTIF